MGSPGRNICTGRRWRRSRRWRRLRGGAGGVRLGVCVQCALWDVHFEGAYGALCTLRGVYVVCNAQLGSEEVHTLTKSSTQWGKAQCSVH